MSSTHSSFDQPEAPTSPDGFDVLDVCHRLTLFTLGKLAALVSRLKSCDPDAEARAMPG